MMLTAREKAALRSFVDRAKYLENHSLIENDILKVRFTFKVDENTKPSMETFVVDEEALESLLLRLRLFYLEEEEIFINKIINYIKREFDDNSLREQLESVRQLSISSREHAFMTIKNEDGYKTSEEIWKAYLYADKFHNREEQKAILKKLKRFDKIVYTIFINATVNKIKAVRMIKNFIVTYMATEIE